MTGRYTMLGHGGLSAFDVRVQGGKLISAPAGREVCNFLVPGFVDIHIHGGFGIDFMSASAAQMLELAEKLGEKGYEAFLPTTVSASAKDVAHALENLPEDDRMPGFHLEGPFISPSFPGAQPKESIIPPPPATEGKGDDKGQSQWTDILNDPRLTVVTMAPELPGALALAKSFQERTVRLSMGHTNATFDEAKKGFESGFRHATHTFNAMRGFHHREAGALGYALAEDAMWTELIYDRKHVSKEAAALLFKLKPREKIIAVSDGTMASGMPEGSTFDMWGRKVRMCDGAVYLDGTRTLAGSAITLLDAFQNLAQDFGVEAAIHACCLNPRASLGMREPPKVWVEFTQKFEFVGAERIRA